MLYFCKAPNIVVGVHGDEQIYVDPVQAYGLSTYVISDPNGPAATQDPNTMKYIYPTVTAAMQAASVKLECRRRIIKKVSEQAQRNITTHINDIQMARMTQAPARVPTPQEQADMDSAAAVWDWIGRPNGMQGASDTLIAANDLDFYQDVKWPPWNSAWDAFVARF